MDTLTKLSVNINKIATLRNSRGGGQPDLIQAAKNIQEWGADGITVHPRPDQRHIRYDDIPELKKVVYKEFNIEGNPRNEEFVKLVLDNRPTQVTLVPDNDNQLTSDHGWDTIAHQDFLQQVISSFKNAGIRVSIFLDPLPELLESAKSTGTDRIELYTESYASNFSSDPASAVKPYSQTAEEAARIGLGVNAGHDLNKENLSYFHQQVRPLDEVSIGHAIISDALYMGLQNTVEIYKRQLES